MYVLREMLSFQVYGCSTHFQEEHLFYELVMKSSLARVSARISQASAQVVVLFS